MIKTNAEKFNADVERALLLPRKEYNLRERQNRRVLTHWLNWLASPFWRLAAYCALRQTLKYRSLDAPPPDEAKVEGILTFALTKLSRDRFHIKFGTVSTWSGVKQTVFGVYRDGQANLSF